MDNVIQFQPPKQFDGRILGTLPNTGAKILAQAGDIVLCQWRNEYVTWRIDKEGNAWAGHYTKDYAFALEDFKERI
jgi:hypothetical protein